MSSDLNKLFGSAKVIDTHAHVVLKETEGAAGEYGPEILFDGEQELLKRIHEIKKELKETEWSESEPPKFTQPSFLRRDLGEEEKSSYLLSKSYGLQEKIKINLVSSFFLLFPDVFLSQKLKKIRTKIVS